MTTAIEKQRDTALQLASQTWTAAGQVRRDIASGQLTVAEALDEPAAACIPLGRLLRAQPRWGSQRADHLLRTIRVQATRRVRDLTPQQREQVADLSTLSRTEVDEWRRDRDIDEWARRI